MLNVHLPAFLLAFTLLPVMAPAEPSCTAPKLSDEDVKAIIDKERARRTDLPAPFAQSKFVVRRQGCHYIYVEHSVPETPDSTNMIWLNQHGVIVDARPNTLKCPDKVFTEGELAEIVRKARERRKDLPPAFPVSTTRVDRLRCLYLYSEFGVPPSEGKHQVFTIDPTGELLDVLRFTR